MDSAKDDGDSAGWVGRRKQGGDQKEKAKLGLSSCVCNAVGVLVMTSATAVNNKPVHG